MSKRKYIILMLMGIIVSIGALSVPTYAKGNKWYKKTIRKYNPAYYKLLDINGDGVKELFLSQRPDGWNTYGAANKVMLFTYYKKKAVLVKTWKLHGYKDGLFYRKKYHTITYFPGLGSEKPTIIYKLKKGKLRRFHYYSESRGSVPSKNKYYLDGKRSTDDKLMKLYREYLWKAKTITYKKR